MFLQNFDWLSAGFVALYRRRCYFSVSVYVWSFLRVSDQFSPSYKTTYELVDLIPNFDILDSRRGNRRLILKCMIGSNPRIESVLNSRYSWTKFWIFTKFHKYLNFDTFFNELLAIFILWHPLYSGDRQEYIPKISFLFIHFWTSRLTKVDLIVFYGVYIFSLQIKSLA
jgi:hypothetical protein